MLTIVREPQGGDRLRTASQFAILDVDLICVSKFGYLEVGINGGENGITDEESMESFSELKG